MSAPFPPTPGREHSPAPFVDHERLARLEERMGANGEDMRKLEESHDKLKKRVETLDLATATAITKLAGEVKWVKWLLVFLGLLGAYNGVLRYFGK